MDEPWAEGMNEQTEYFSRGRNGKMMVCLKMFCIILTGQTPMSHGTIWEQTAGDTMNKIPLLFGLIDDEMRKKGLK